MKVFIGEYYASYTGGSIVWLANTPEFIKDFLLKAERDELNLSPVDTEIYNRLYLIQYKEEGNWKGEIEREEYSKILESLSEELQDRIAAIDVNDYSYSSGKKKVRLDWLVDKLKIPDGIYIVSEIETLEKEERFISDTYYCA